MSSRFIALPVGQGDAFYLQRGNLHILVDGGRGVRSLPDLLKNHANPPRLDVVVCTHNDADHANGLIGLFEELPVPIHEVWLPGTWAWRFKDLVTTPEEFLHELERGISEIQGEVRTLEECYELHSEWEFTETSESDRLIEPGADGSEWFLDIINRQDVWFCERYLWYLFPKYYIRFHKHWRLWIDCLNAAHRIKAIAEAALNAGARIRLFEFVQAPGMVTGGRRGQIEPVNSREVWPRKVVVPAVFWLALTKANRESLVFYAPERLEENAPSVLFCADSDLGCGLGCVASPVSNLIATSPHHGSEANATAYRILSKWSDDVIWVRSDCRSKTRPGTSFKSQMKRLCTICNPPSNPKAAVRLHAIQSRWQRTRGTRWCSCK